MIDPNQLAALPLFAGLNAAALQTLARRSTERRLLPDQVLFTAGSEPDHLIIILTGHVRVVRGHAGRQILVHEECAGGALGEVPLFAGGTYPATAIATEPTRCLLISMDAIRTAIGEDPQLAFVFLRRLALRVRGMVGQLDHLAIHRVEARVARLLLRRHAELQGQSAFLLGRTQTQVAEELGTVREVLVRTLRQLRESGAISAAGRGYYRVEDAARLREVAEA